MPIKEIVIKAPTPMAQLQRSRLRVTAHRSDELGAFWLEIGMDPAMYCITLSTDEARQLADVINDVLNAPKRGTTMPIPTNPHTGASTMKLNPPETAPKDGSVFLGRFGCRLYLQAAMYTTFEDEDSDRPWHWVAALPVKERGSLLNQVFGPYVLTGWLPMPKIDEEGNVR